MTHFAVLIPVAKQIAWACGIIAVLTPITRPFRSQPGFPRFPDSARHRLWITSCMSR